MNPQEGKNKNKNKFKIKTFPMSSCALLKEDKHYVLRFPILAHARATLINEARHYMHLNRIKQAQFY